MRISTLYTEAMVKVLCECSVCCWVRHFQLGLPSLSWSVSVSLLPVPLSSYASAPQSLRSVTWYSQELHYPLKHGVTLEIGWRYFCFGSCGRAGILPSQIHLERVSSKQLLIAVLITVTIAPFLPKATCVIKVRRCQNTEPDRLQINHHLVCCRGNPTSSKEMMVQQCPCGFK